MESDSERRLTVVAFWQALRAGGAVPGGQLAHLAVPPRQTNRLCFLKSLFPVSLFPWCSAVGAKVSLRVRSAGSSQENAGGLLPSWHGR